LLGVAYTDTHPVRLHVSPLLATVHDGVRSRATEHLLRFRAQQVADLLQRLVALSTGAAAWLAPVERPEADDEIVEALDHLACVLAVRAGRPAGPDPVPGLGYRRLVTRIRRTIVTQTPPGAVVAVVSRGDDDLTDIEGRTVWHLPEDGDGRWAGYHPADSDGAIAAVTSALRRGATHLVIPVPSGWWLHHYPAFAEYLAMYHRGLHTDEDCVVYALTPESERVHS
jgi:hypothetical protein